jgi:AraC-like DNA-binding protein
MRDGGTVSVLTARPVVRALEGRGLDPARALRAAALSREALASIEVRLPHENVARLWEAAAESADDPAFGVHVAEALPSGEYDVIDYVLSKAPTLGEGLASLTKYIRLIYDGSDIQLVVEPRHGRLVRRVAVPACQYDEFTMTLLTVRSRQASGVGWTPDFVAFQHVPASDGSELRRVFGCEIAVGASESELRFAAPILDLPQKGADSRLLAVLARYGDTLLASLPTQGDLPSRVASLITREITRTLPSLSSTAQALRMPERTLQRHLAAAGLTHSALVDDARRSLALKYIGDAGITIAEVGYLLQFSDATAFHRAFKRWTGETPTQYRQRLFEGRESAVGRAEQPR